MNPAGFSFPLNVYAALLLWSEGRVEHLHYGLFETADEPASAAQARASERLWSQMPPPCRVLEVGIGLGTTLEGLQQRGYQALGITPDLSQIEALRTRWPGAPVLASRLEDLDLTGEPFDLMLLQESAQYIEPMALFEAAERLLRPRATLLVMDEFALRRDSDADRGLHLLPHFLALAHRFGWRMAHDEDVTPAARRTLDVLLALTRRYRPRLISELGVSAAELDLLDESNARYRDNYARGIFGYRLLRLERDARAPRHPVSVVSAHGPAMRDLFGRIFGRQLGADEWAWKYRHGQGVGSMCGDVLEAFYGGLTRPLLMNGQPAVGCQVCDVMVSPHANAALGRRGVLYDITASFLEAQIGWARPHAVGFGFPNDRALVVAERLGLYRRVDQMLEIDWPAAAAAGTSGAEARTVDPAALREGDAQWRVIDACWSAMAQDLPHSVLGVRDAAWLAYRYGCKPGVRHELLLIGSEAVVVVRQHERMLELLDLVAPRALWPAAVAAARRRAGELGLPLLRLWVTASHAGAFEASATSGEVRALNLHIPANAHTAGVPPQALRDRWFLMGGDTDFR